MYMYIDIYEFCIYIYAYINICIYVYTYISMYIRLNIYR